LNAFTIAFGTRPTRSRLARSWTLIFVFAPRSVQNCEVRKVSYIHLGRFFGAEPSGREIRWSGAAFFKVRDGKITELWVLGDIEAIRRQLDPQRAVADFQV